MKNYKDWHPQLPYALWGIGHQFGHPQEPLLIHWCMGWRRSFPLKWVFIHWEQYWRVKSLKWIGC